METSSARINARQCLVFPSSWNEGGGRGENCHKPLKEVEVVSRDKVDQPYKGIPDSFPLLPSVLALLPVITGNALPRGRLNFCANPLTMPSIVKFSQAKAR